MDVWVVNRDDGWHDEPPEAVFVSAEAVRAAYPHVEWVQVAQDELQARGGSGHEPSIFARRFTVR